MVGGAAVRSGSRVAAARWRWRCPGSTAAACLPAESAAVHPAVPGGHLLRHVEAAQDFVGVVLNGSHRNSWRPSSPRTRPGSASTTSCTPGHRPTTITRRSGRSPWRSARCASSSPSLSSASRSLVRKHVGVGKRPPGSGRGHAAVPHPEHERAEPVCRCTVVIRIEPPQAAAFAGQPGVLPQGCVEDRDRQPLAPELAAAPGARCRLEHRRLFRD